MQNYIGYKANGISNYGVNSLETLNYKCEFEDLYKITKAEQLKVRSYDFIFGTDTTSNCNIKQNFSENLYYKYQPTNYSFLEYIFKKYPFLPSDHLFDFGFGRGRVIYMAALHKCRKISGCELDKEYYDLVLSKTREENYRFIKDAIIDIVNDNAQNIIFDLSINKFFFFNPFHLKVYIRVFKNILRSYNANKRKILLFFYCPLQSTIEYIDRFLNFHLLEKVDIDEEHILFAVYQIS